MTRDEAVARIQQGIGFRSDLNDQIISALKEAKRRLEKGRTLPMFLLQEQQTITVSVANGGLFPYPTGFLREWQEEPPSYGTTGNDGGDDVISDVATICFPEKLDYNVAKARFINADAGRPLAYSLRKTGLQFFPTPDATYTLDWAFFQASVDLSTNVANNEWLDENEGNPEALIGKAGMIITADLGPEAAATVQKFASMYAEAWGNAVADDQLKDEENRPLAMGSRL